jgi:hypothetical protein
VASRPEAHPAEHHHRRDSHPHPTSTQTTGSGTVSYAVHPGVFCSEHWQYGYTSAGTLMRCTTTATDSSFRWRSA